MRTGSGNDKSKAGYLGSQRRIDEAGKRKQTRVAPSLCNSNADSINLSY